VSYRTNRPIAAFAALTLAIGLFALVGGVGGASAASTSGLRNGGFDSTRNGWTVTPAHRARLSLTTAGRAGKALLIRKTRRAAVSVRTARPIAMTGTAGSRYQASGWVRASRTGERVRITLREYAGSKVVRTARRSASLRAGVWTELSTGLTRSRTGTTYQVRFTLARGRRTDRLTLDQVGLSRVTTATTTTSGSACLTSRGVPQCGGIMGSAYGGNTDPTTFESTINHKLGIRRTYWTGSQVDSAVRAAKTDLANGRIPWISFKLPYSWEQMASGTGDAWAKDLATKLAALPGPVWVAFHHEPEGDGDITAWTAMQAHLAPLVRATAPNVAYTIVLTGWNQLYGATQYHLDNLWPKNTKIDIAGFDVYNELGVVKNGVLNTKGDDLPNAYFKPLSAWAKAHGIPWGIAETGYTDYASERYPHWIQQTYASLRSYGGVAFTYFNTTLNAYGSWALSTSTKVADYEDAQAQSPMLR